jgi:hypothetical protein
MQEGRMVAATEGPNWQMSPGHMATFKLLSRDTGDSIAVFEELVPPATMGRHSTCTGRAMKSFT